MHDTDVIIIGAGPVGLFAIFQAGMLEMRCHIVDSQERVGGQCSFLYPEKPIYDIPAYPKIMAVDLIKCLEEQARPFNAVYHLSQQVTCMKQEGKSFQVNTCKNTKITAKAIIIAAGCGAFGPNKPPIAGIEAFEGKSVFYFIHNRNYFADKEIVIAGGGDSAVDWAISLSEIAKKIYLVHRREKFKAAPESIRQLKELANSGKIELVINYQLDHLVGQDGRLESVGVRDFEGSIRTLPANILLPFFGLMQELGPIKNWGLNIKNNHILVDPTSCAANIPGIYAIGDIASYPGKLKLILTGFAEAASSMHHAYSRVFEGKALHFEYSTTKGLPLPPHIDNDIIFLAIKPDKDVDGFHPVNVGYLHSGSGEGFVPCTALGCRELLKQVEPSLAENSESGLQILSTDPKIANKEKNITAILTDPSVNGLDYFNPVGRETRLRIDAQQQFKDDKDFKSIKVESTLGDAKSPFDLLEVKTSFTHYKLNNFKSIEVGVKDMPGPLDFKCTKFDKDKNNYPVLALGTPEKMFKELSFIGGGKVSINNSFEGPGIGTVNAESVNISGGTTLVLSRRPRDSGGGDYDLTFQGNEINIEDSIISTLAYHYSGEVGLHGMIKGANITFELPTSKLFLGNVYGSGPNNTIEAREKNSKSAGGLVIVPQGKMKIIGSLGYVVTGDSPIAGSIVPKRNSSSIDGRRIRGDGKFVILKGAKLNIILHDMIDYDDQISWLANPNKKYNFEYVIFEKIPKTSQIELTAEDITIEVDKVAKNPNTQYDFSKLKLVREPDSESLGVYDQLRISIPEAISFNPSGRVGIPDEPPVVKPIELPSGTSDLEKEYKQPVNVADGGTIKNNPEGTTFEQGITAKDPTIDLNNAKLVTKDQGQISGEVKLKNTYNLQDQAGGQMVIEPKTMDGTALTRVDVNIKLQGDKDFNPQEPHSATVSVMIVRPGAELKLPDPVPAVHTTITGEGDIIWGTDPARATILGPGGITVIARSKVIKPDQPKIELGEGETLPMRGNFDKEIVANKATVVVEEDATTTKNIDLTDSTLEVEPGKTMTVESGKLTIKGSYVQKLDYDAETGKGGTVAIAKDGELDMGGVTEMKGEGQIQKDENKKIGDQIVYQAIDTSEADKDKIIPVPDTAKVEVKLNSEAGVSWEVSEASNKVTKDGLKIEAKVTALPKPVDPTDPSKPDPVDPHKPDPVDPSKPDPVDPHKPDPVDPHKPDQGGSGKPDPVNPHKPDQGGSGKPIDNGNSGGTSGAGGEPPRPVEKPDIAPPLEPITITKQRQAMEKLQNSLPEDLVQTFSHVKIDDNSSAARFMAGAVEMSKEEVTEAGSKWQNVSHPAAHMMSAADSALTAVHSGISTKMAQTLVGAGSNDGSEEDGRELAEVSGQTTGSQMSLWVSPFYSYGKQKAKDEVSGYSLRGSGGSVGIDFKPSENSVLGVAYSRVESKAKYQDQKVGDSTKIHLNIFSLYGTQYFNSQWFLEGIVSYGEGRVKNNEGRVVANAVERAVGKYKARIYSGQVISGYNYRLTENETLTPLAGIRYSKFKDDGYQEEGTSNQNLMVQKRSQDRVELIAGAKLASMVKLQSGSLLPELQLSANYNVKKEEKQKIDAQLDGLEGLLPTKSYKPEKLSCNLGTTITPNTHLAQTHLMQVGYHYFNLSDDNENLPWDTIYPNFIEIKGEDLEANFEIIEEALRYYDMICDQFLIKSQLVNEQDTDLLAIPLNKLLPGYKLVFAKINPIDVEINEPNNEHTRTSNCLRGEAEMMALEPGFILANDVIDCSPNNSTQLQDLDPLILDIGKDGFLTTQETGFQVMDKCIFEQVTKVSLFVISKNTDIQTQHMVSKLAQNATIIPFKYHSVCGNPKIISIFSAWAKKVQQDYNLTQESADYIRYKGIQEFLGLPGILEQDSDNLNNSQGSGNVSTGSASNDAYCSGDHGGFDTCTPPAVDNTNDTASVGNANDTAKNDSGG
ncbi:Ferredoxin--NADP reductase [Pseudolycoriella hygida]|uniref:Ferredoxin--NADP reductase n=1 Tax=Pseudolycoriella hygida TaxID=35572 RepID=A0A9Q0N7P2_9DIPT|nr:Ferredoxin--NADP reductase [Pseudolycoriella hygida]